MTASIEMRVGRHGGRFRTMLDFSTAPARPRTEVVAALERAIRWLVAPGTSWDGNIRRSIALQARALRLGRQSAAVTPSALAEVVETMSVRPASTSRRWVDLQVERIGLAGYVEILGVVSRITAIDAFHRMLGLSVPDLPPAQPGEAGGAPPEVEQGPTWIPAGRFPTPPLVLSAVPDEVDAQNDLSDVLYMTVEEMADPDWSRRGMHRAQAELAASAVSHGNECFY
jgi:hypothetical protein